MRNHDPCISCAAHFLDVTVVTSMTDADGPGWWWPASAASTAATTASVPWWPPRAVEHAGAGRDIGPLTDPLDLLGAWDGADLAIVVDAVRSGAARARCACVDLRAATAPRRPLAEPADQHARDRAGRRPPAGPSRRPRPAAGGRGRDRGRRLRPGPGTQPGGRRRRPRRGRPGRRADRRGPRMCMSRLHRVVADGRRDRRRGGRRRYRAPRLAARPRRATAGDRGVAGRPQRLRHRPGRRHRGRGGGGRVATDRMRSAP